MAKYQATTSFCGLVDMTKDEVREFDKRKHRAVINDLVKAGYIVEVGGEQAPASDDVEAEKEQDFETGVAADED